MPNRVGGGFAVSETHKMWFALVKSSNVREK
jgi:hypothetical protein